MKSLKVDIEASVEKDIRNCLRVWPKLLFIGAGLVVSGGLLPALYEPVIAMFKELFSPNFISAAIGSVFFMAGLAAFTFGRGGGVLEPVRSWMMNIAQQIASHIWSACSFAAPIFIGAAGALFAVGQWRSAMILGYFCLVLVVLGAVPRICIYSLEIVPPANAGSLLRNGRLQGLFLLSASLLILRELVINPA
ncbi:hypothetical protein [Stenotrophomonas indicatrix]|jgi:hypothetical protein|uniref:hypothetical protein n=1 Tax=Stenotrophomonas indicatrix TaxID=2045451 RepID=UPI002657010D|nr:hypothetical protein [Stenotrophomonas indicatrix]MDN8643136.1 hypothetical protein [Stenotrophomonas indicatrix]MDN8654015.1 hypothetical protein [Stenotrophomonas indicatrix]